MAEKALSKKADRILDTISQLDSNMQNIGLTKKEEKEWETIKHIITLGLAWEELKKFNVDKMDSNYKIIVEEIISKEPDKKRKEYFAGKQDGLSLMKLKMGELEKEGK